MNLKTFALLGLPVVLFGCPPGDSDDSDLPIDTAPPTDTDTDTDTDTEPPPELGVTVTFNAATLELEIANGVGEYHWGFGQTAVEAASPGNGWFGEDCYLGTGATTACHPAGTTGVSLAYVTTIAAVVEGSTTLVPNDTPDMTYILLNADETACWVWGDDTSYYAAHPAGPSFSSVAMLLS